MADRVKPIPQSEKRIDASGGSGGVGQNVGKHNERFNDYQNNGILYPDSSDYNHIEGTENHITSGSCNSVSGQRNSTGKNSSIVGGYNNENNSNWALVGGINNKVEADGSLTAGEGLLNTFGGQRVVLGKYNKQTGAPFIFGGGRSDSERDNLLELDGSGNLHVKGNVYAGGSGGIGRTYALRGRNAISEPKTATSGAAFPDELSIYCTTDGSIEGAASITVQGFTEWAPSGAQDTTRTPFTLVIPYTGVEITFYINTSWSAIQLSADARADSNSVRVRIYSADNYPKIKTITVNRIDLVQLVDTTPEGVT